MRKIINQADDKGKNYIDFVGFSIL